MVFIVYELINKIANFQLQNSTNFKPDRIYFRVIMEEKLQADVEVV